MPADTAQFLAALRREARPLGGIDDVTPVLELVGDAPLVLLGEATHGTHEFYRLRAHITQRLIETHGFDAVAVEADWPDALRVGRYVTGDPRVPSLDGALGGFVRFPRWMWRNEETASFVQWLRQRNDRTADPAARAGFFGLDLYSLRSSIHAVVRYLEGVDPALARQARARYDCFDHVASDPQRYGYATRYGMADDCEQPVVQQLQTMLGDAVGVLGSAGPQAADELFYAQQNAAVVRGAEQYYRVMYRGGPDAWNLRDTHMADTLDALRQHLSSRRGRPAKVVVWAHNSHIGDARATDMSARGEINLGQLVRERAAAASDTFLLGFTTHIGTVAAASDWDEPVQRLRVRPSRADSVERRLHDAGLSMAVVPLRGMHQPLAARHLERAIGVIYRPDTELHSHYFGVALSSQFDAVLHVDETRAVTPLDPSDLWQRAGAEETYPSGL